MSVGGGSIQILRSRSSRQNYSRPAGKNDKQSYRLADIVLMYRQILGAEIESRNVVFSNFFALLIAQAISH